MSRPASPEMSVVISTPDNYQTIRRTMSHLRRQTARELLEEFLAWLQSVSMESLKEKSGPSARRTVKRFLENRPEPIGRSLRKAMGHPFP